MSKNISSNMSGILVKYLVKVGDEIKEDQDVVVLESMKMEMMIPATASGKVKELSCKPEDFVQEGQVVLVLE